ncbi:MULTISPECIES: IS607 family element RNA-guided endonuclease TnpB [unclassified Parafrankia]|uniref:IS607 family element RNA-guided endonuclease TnpB n=1 Tax=unclassified Parafrankia TaxID=2994368 RepID=UPI000DA4F642|nr:MULTISPECIES: IS607 family element RNA-guided endonuclease TnpB [unclassified Parafrankia]TCJ35329.1 transposase [Parafrankia sp. BMG5.11]CAI7977418.1 transposase [Frankia sp. Hr75.2]SQD94212.1 transposase [Parafrankia sp. Ea1.12]
MRTVQAYRFALDPNEVQRAALTRHAGAARFAYNWGLSRVKAALAQREAEKSYGVPGDLLTPVPWTLPALRLEWNKAKAGVAPWWAECSKEAYSAGLDQLARGLKNFTASRHGRRKGRRVGFPRFKKRGKARDSFRYTTGSYGPDGDRHVKLPRIGRVKACEAMGALTGRLAGGRARLLGATVARTASRWFVSFTVEVDREVPTGPSRSQRTAGPVGVDVGVKHLAVLSTGEMIANPRYLAGSLRRLRSASRAYARSTPGSAGRRKRAARLARIHARVAHQRRNGLHTLTTRLAKTHDTIVVEDLHVAGMVRNRRLARAVSDTGMAQIRRQLTYKTGWYGSRLIVADRWYPSSKTCSGCGWRNPSLTLSDRTFRCQPCGLVLDRDVNAAVNLRNLVAASASETENTRGADRKTHSGGRVAGKREPGTASAGQTGSAAPQGTAG